MLILTGKILEITGHMKLPVTRLLFSDPWVGLCWYVHSSLSGLVGELDHQSTVRYSMRIIIIGETGGYLSG